MGAAMVPAEDLLDVEFVRWPGTLKRPRRSLLAWFEAARPPHSPSSSRATLHILHS